MIMPLITAVLFIGIIFYMAAIALAAAIDMIRIKRKGTRTAEEFMQVLELTRRR